MKPIKTFTVSPILPQRLTPLKELAYNLRWSWDAETRELFRRLDMDLWEKVNHNPVLLLGMIDQKILDKKANDDSFTYFLDQVYEKFKYSMERKTWFNKDDNFNKKLHVAYFSMEYGISEAIPIYSGGLGVLSGDHLKSSSELGIPLFGIGLSYQKGYFQQVLNVNGWQEEKYPVNDFYNMPLTLIKDKKGDEKVVSIDFPGRKVHFRIWKVQVGRIPLYLLDTNISLNSDEDRHISAELYGGNNEMRMKQEIVLGMGGVKIIKALKLQDCIIHMNEGHSAFSGLERIRELIKTKGLSFETALEAVKASSVFTTHTPVKAGIDIFPHSLVEKYFENFCKDINISIDTLLGLGRKEPENSKEDFSMAILAIKLSYKTNGVSELHGEVSRKMWKSQWPDVLEKEIPITSVTNGVHHASWISKEISQLFNRYLGPKWLEEPADKVVWKKVNQIPNGELWRTHGARRARLVGFARKKLVEYYKEIGLHSQLDEARSVLNCDALTIGFARRFATYKRATLFFSDKERLAKLLTNKDRPVQIIIAGKAHPHDEYGKNYIKEILKLAQEEPFRQHVVFLENYNINIARYLVQGCDVWLNSPRRGLEACGTSGMKAAANGALNFSTLDGWWDEIYRPEIGWPIGQRETFEDKEYWDKQDANALYRVLETQIIPTFYERSADQLPHKWISLMKNSMVDICPIYNTNRMLQEYTFSLYTPSANRSELRILNVKSDNTNNFSIENTLSVESEVYLGELSPKDVDIQIFYGVIDSEGEISKGEFISMKLEKTLDNKKYFFKGVVDYWKSGLNGFTLRIIPNNKNLSHPFEDALIYWY